MERVEQPIYWSQHAREQVHFRGCTEAEVERAVRTAEWGPAELGRSECRLAFPLNSEWNGKRYATKTVRPIFAVERTGIVIVTVYVYYA